MRPMRICFEHSRRVEVPHRCPRHDIQAVRPKDRKVDGCIDLFHEAGLLGAGADPSVNGERADDSLHEEFAGKGENDDIEGHEGEVTGTFPILCRGVGAADGVGRY
jgi:hypothetical protein